MVKSISAYHIFLSQLYDFLYIKENNVIERDCAIKVKLMVAIHFGEKLRDNDEHDEFLPATET